MFAVVQRGDGSGEYEPARELFHELLWQHHHGALPEGHVVCHRNGITVDNRLANLELLPEETAAAQAAQAADGAGSRRRSSELYRLAVARLPAADLEDAGSRGEGERMTPDGVSVVVDAVELEQGGDPIFSECMRAECCRIETAPFLRCPACGVARYCSPGCMRLDQEAHARDCEVRGGGLVVVER